MEKQISIRLPHAEWQALRTRAKAARRSVKAQAETLLLEALHALGKPQKQQQQPTQQPTTHAH